MCGFPVFTIAFIYFLYSSLYKTRHHFVFMSQMRTLSLRVIYTATAMQILNQGLNSDLLIPSSEIFFLDYTASFQ